MATENNSTSGPLSIKRPLAGGSPVTLASGLGEIVGIVADAGFVYMAARFSNPGQILRVPIGGGSQTVMADMQGNPAAIAQDDTYLYWANGSAGTVMKRAK